MKKTKFLTFIINIAIFILTCCTLTACNNSTLPNANTDVVKAFNAISPTGEVITQTAVLVEDQHAFYTVTVITTDSVVEYTLDENFKVEQKNDILVNNSSTKTAAEELSDLEKAYAEALRLSEIAPDKVTGFDFDIDIYMGKSVYKVEIEEVGAKYEFIFDAIDFTLLKREIEFESDYSQGSYISEKTAYELALKAAEVTNVTESVVRSEFEDGRKIYKVSFNYASYRYDVSVDAVSGDIVKFSKSVIENQKVPQVAQNITIDEAKAIALEFVFPNGEVQTEYTFRKVKIDCDDGRFIYEIELLAKNSEYELDIDAMSGEILDVEIEGVKSYESEPLPQNKTFITREQAIEAVKKVAGEDIYILEVEIDKENGNYFYEIEVRGTNGVKREYKVDALTGEVFGNSIPTDTVITESEAILKTLEAFGLDENAIDRKIVKLEMDDGILCYKVKLYVNNIEYEAEIDATTGMVLEKDIDSGQTPPTTTDRLTREQAIAKLKEYLGNQSNAFIGDVELEYENGRYFYEIEVIVGGREYDYFVDATAGDVSKNSDFVSGGKDVITEEEALTYVLKFFGLSKDEAGFRLRKIKLEYDDFRLIYDIEFYIGNLEYEAEIDASTGNIIATDVSYD